MRKTAGLFTLWWFALALGSSMVGTGCGGHHYYRVYDPYYTDYHVWNHQEEDNYRSWARDTHHDPNRDFRKLPPDEQKQYWTWRHNHEDRGQH